MADDPEGWPEPWVYDDWLKEKLRADKNWQVKQRQEAERRLMERATSEFSRLLPAPPSRNPEVREARLKEFEGNFALRKWAVWRQYKAGGTTLRKVGEDFGIGPERVRQMVAKCDRMIKATLNRAAPGFPANAEVREATRGVEFVFRNDLTFVGWDGDQRGWEQLEPTAVGSAYDPLIPDWKKEWGRQDKSEPKPRPAYTYYKVIVPKEQTDATETDNG